jgi:hypothetical protein
VSAGNTRHGTRCVNEQLSEKRAKAAEDSKVESRGIASILQEYAMHRGTWAHTTNYYCYTYRTLPIIQGIGENLEQKEMNRFIWRLSMFMTVLQNVTAYLTGTAGPISEHCIWLQKP